MIDIHTEMGGAGHFQNNFKGTPSWTRLKTVCRQLSPKLKNFLQVLEGAANPCSTN
jgi:hypothetical protein